MFTIALAIFLIFGVLYLLFVAAIFYHLRQYTLPGQKAPRLASVLFLSLSGLFLLFALYFLFRIPY